LGNLIERKEKGAVKGAVLDEERKARNTTTKNLKDLGLEVLRKAIQFCSGDASRKTSVFTKGLG